MCAYPTDQTNQTARWSHIQDIIDVLQGTTADRLQIIQYSNASYYAGDFRNLETGSSLGLRIRDASNNVIGTFAKNAIVLGASAANDALAINCNISGKMYLGDSSNAKQTVGITINQGANDDEILAFKSSDVSQAMTDYAEADTFANLGKAGATTGGLYVRGFSSGSIGMSLEGDHTTDVTTKATSSTAAILLTAGLRNGTAATSCGADANLLALRNWATTRLIVDAEGHIHSIGATATDMLGNGKWLLNETSNANQTLGLTINQGASDDEALALKSSDVGHTVTAQAESDTWALAKKTEADSGGLHLIGLKDSEGLAKGAVWLHGILDEAALTSKDTSGAGVVMIDASIGSAGTVGAVGADGNLVSISNNTTVRFIFDAEGSAHGDVEWVAFDDYDDLALIASLEAHMGADPVKAAFGDWVKYNKDALQAAKIVNFYNEGPRAMLNTTRLSMLLCGAVRQLGQRLALAESRLAALPAAS